MGGRVSGAGVLGLVLVREGVWTAGRRVTFLLLSWGAIRQNFLGATRADGSGFTGLRAEG